jgi:tetratricopeptide (TPR) repeat protein
MMSYNERVNREHALGLSDWEESGKIFFYNRLARPAKSRESKSQIAIEYAYRVRERHPDTWVFWVHASSATRFEETYRDIAARLQLPGRDEPKADVLALVHRWLSDESNVSWTMVVDNADEPAVMFEPRNGGASSTTASSSTAQSLSDFLPLSSHGSLVITSRSREVVERLQVFSEDVLDVEPMEINVATDLFLKKLKKTGRETITIDMERLVKHLDCMPLAITQAAAYIEQAAPRMAVSKYMEILVKNDSERAALLQKDVRDVRRDKQASNSIIMTWHVTFTHLRQTHDSAARLLALMSLFDREAMPDHLLRGRYAEATDSPNDFEDDIVTLRAYSLIGVGVDDGLFDMHRLVQLSTQKWLEMHSELQAWQERYIDILRTAFPTSEYANWTTCQALFPHVVVMQSYRVTDADHVQMWAWTLCEGARYTWERGQYGIADQLARASLQARQEILGVDDAETLDSMNMVALVLEYQGKYELAEEINRRALAGKEKVQGMDHPSTLESMDNLAVVLRYQWKYEQAEDINRRALAGRAKVLGMDHPDTLISMNNLAIVLQHQGKSEQAEEMNRRALAGKEKLLDHPETLTSMDNLALVLRYQGKYKQAEEMNRQALAGKETVLGMDHPDTLTSVYCLAQLLSELDDHHQLEALELYERATTGFNKVLGPEHPKTIACQENYTAFLLDKRGTSEKDHPDTIASQRDGALLLDTRGTSKTKHPNFLAKVLTTLHVKHSRNSRRSLAEH